MLHLKYGPNRCIHQQYFTNFAALLFLTLAIEMTIVMYRRAICLVISLVIASVSSFSLTMMASKYLGKSPVFVAGGSNGVGYELVKQLSQLGTPVHALVRREVFIIKN